MNYAVMIINLLIHAFNYWPAALVFIHLSIHQPTKALADRTVGSFINFNSMYFQGLRTAANLVVIQLLINSFIHRDGPW